MKYASGFAIYETRLAMTSGSATGNFIISESTIPEAFAVSTSTDNDITESFYVILAWTTLTDVSPDAARCVDVDRDVVLG